MFDACLMAALFLIMGTTVYTQKAVIEVQGKKVV